MFSSNLEALKIQKFPSPLAPTMVGPAGDTELSKSLHIFFANRFLILNWNPPRSLSVIASNQKIYDFYKIITFEK